jgi:hypothetical protein
VRFASGVTTITGQIVFDTCEFSGTTFGMNTATGLSGTDQEVDGVVVQNSNFNLLYQGITLGTRPLVNGGATGFRIVGNKFDNIYTEGVLFGLVSLNATGHNSFYGVGNHFGPTTTPYSACINIQTANNISISDLFERGDAFSDRKDTGVSWPRIDLNNRASIATTNGSELAMGTYIRQSGQQFTLLGTGPVAPVPIFTVDSTVIRTFNINYTIIRDVGRRTGTIQVASDPTGGVTSVDTYTENTSTGVSLFVFQSVDTITISYVSTVGVTGTLNYSINYLP